MRNIRSILVFESTWFMLWDKTWRCVKPSILQHCNDYLYVLLSAGISFCLFRAARYSFSDLFMAKVLFHTELDELFGEYQYLILRWLPTHCKYLWLYRIYFCYIKHLDLTYVRLACLVRLKKWLQRRQITTFCPCCELYFGCREKSDKHYTLKF